MDVAEFSLGVVIVLDEFIRDERQRAPWRSSLAKSTSHWKCSPIEQCHPAEGLRDGSVPECVVDLDDFACEALAVGRFAEFYRKPSPNRTRIFRSSSRL